MKVACVLLSDFEVAVELVRYPDLVGKPVIVGGLPHERKSVRSRSQEAAACGVTEEMPLREAQGLCPEATFLPADDDLYRRALSRVLTALDAFSPRVEAISHQSSVIGQKRASKQARSEENPPLPLGEGRGEGLPQSPTPNTQHPTQSSVLIYIDASGLEMLFGPDQELGERIIAVLEARMSLRSRVGIASRKFVAQMAATTAKPGAVVVVKPGEERAFLAPLPVEWIPCSQEMRRRLDLFGLRTMGQLATLPRGALGEQFGREGVEAARLARGVDGRPVVPRDLPVVLREEVEIDPPTGDNHILVTVARQLTKRLERRMKVSFTACQDVTLDIGFEDGMEIRLETALHEPTDQADTVLRTAERLLGRAYARVADNYQLSVISHQSPAISQEPGDGGWGMGGGSTSHQESTSLPSLPLSLTPSLPLPLVSLLRISLSDFGNAHGEQLELLSSRAGNIKKIQQAVRRTEELFGKEAIRPLSEPDQGRPPASRIGVIAEPDSSPHVLFIDKKRERVREVSNRWRVQEEWWRREVLREYYRVVTGAGKLCLIYRDLLGGGWFLERIYG